jgi:hypothetical protein
MAYSDHDIATKALDAHESTFFELVVESQNASASCVKGYRILKQVEPNQVAEKK